MRVRIGQKLIVVELYDKGDPVGVFSGHRPQHAERRSYGVAASLDGEFDDVFGVEIDRVRRERRSRAVFDPLVHGQDRKISRSGQTTCVEKKLEVPHDSRRPVRSGDDAVHKIRSGKVKLICRKLRLVLEQILCLVSEEFLNSFDHYRYPLRIELLFPGKITKIIFPLQKTFLL